MKFFIFLITCSAFALGISVGHYKYQPFDTIVKVKSYLISSKKKKLTVIIKNLIVWKKKKPTFPTEFEVTLTVIAESYDFVVIFFVCGLVEITFSKE